MITPLRWALQNSYEYSKMGSNDNENNTHHSLSSLVLDLKFDWCEAVPPKVASIPAREARVPGLA